MVIRTEREDHATGSSAEQQSGGSGEEQDDDDIPELVSPGLKRPSSAAPVLVVFKLVAALTIAGFVAGSLSFVLVRFDLYGLFTWFLDRQGVETKVFVGLFVVAVIVVLPNVLTWREFAKAFQIQGAGPRRRPQPRRATQRRGSASAKSAKGEQGPDGKATERPDGTASQGGPAGEQAASAVPEPETADVAEAKKSIMTFFTHCVDFLKKTSSQFLKSGKLDTFNRFGCDLFLAGASEAYAERKAVAEKGKDIMAAVLRAAGRENDRAAQFADKHENYLLETRYLDMFRAGREAMTIFLKDEELRAKAASGELTDEDKAALGGESEGDIGMFLENALDHWTAKKDDKKAGGTVAVMFTAILGGFTEAVGDESTQKMVHAHNRIVRESLRRFGGNEVKQTNDGIMASFPQASQAVEAAVGIQRGAKMHTATSPDVPLHVKIGINVGELISENNHLFGTPVQLAARVWAAAGQDQIAVSKLVRDLCQGKGLRFRDLSGAEFKGFAEKMPVYEAEWRDESEILPE